MEFNTEKREYFYNTVTHNFGYYVKSFDSKSAAFYEILNKQTVLRCMCGLEELEQRLNEWNFISYPSLNLQTKHGYSF